MASRLPDRTRPQSLDPRALDRAWARLAAAPEPPWLHAEVARRMAERLTIVRQVPEQVLDWWSALGASASALGAAYPKATLLQVRRPGDPAPAADARPAWRRWFGRPAQSLAQAEVVDGQAQLLWSNMSLHWAADWPALLAAWHRAVAVDGFLMFSTLGPGTLDALRRTYAAAGWGPPYPPWVDMHDLGDLLVAAGFADPVMDQETLRLSYSSPAAALAELRQLGANTDNARFAGLRTPRWRDRLHAALGAQRDARDRWVLDFEVVYGHAFRPAPRPRIAPRTDVDLADMKLMLRKGRAGSSARLEFRS